MESMKKTEQIIEEIETLLIELKQSINVLNKTPLHRKEKSKSAHNQGSGFSGLTGNIFELLEEGFFNDPKTISDLQKKLKDRGIKKPTTALMPSLKHLVIKKVLDRKKPDKGLYQYFKR